jgi:uncharacterized membrane protein YbhN (UPF0104 family)
VTEPFAIVAAGIASAADRLAGVDVALLAIAICGQLVYSGLRALAWRNVVQAAYPEQRVGFVDVTAANSAAAGVAAVTIGHAGNAVKAAIVRSRVPGSTLAAIAATLGVVALFDATLGIASLLAAWQLGAVHFTPVPSSASTAAIVVATLVVVASILAIWFARKPDSRLGRILREAVGRGTTVLRQPAGYLRRVAAVQLMAFVVRIGVVFAFLHAFGIPASLPDALLVVVVMGLASAVPSGPGGAGTQQIAVVIALHGTAPAAAAISFGIGMQLVITGYNVLLGLAAGTYLFGTWRPRLMVRHGRALLATERAG